MINAGVVVRLLSEVYQINQQPATPADFEFAETLKALVKNRLVSKVLYFEEEDDLHMEHDTDDFEPTAMEFENEAEPEFSGSSYEPSPGKQRSYCGIQYKESAVEFWKSGANGRRRSFKCVQNRFRLLKSRSDLYRWKRQLEKRGLARTFATEKGRAIQLEVLQKYREAKKLNLIVHDIDLRKWALTANKNVQLQGFHASNAWVYKFKVHHRIVSRKITKMVTQRYMDNLENLEQQAMVFVNSVLPKIEKNSATVYNVDQSGFQREMHSGRTLADKGSKRVFAQAQSLHSLSHSYTIQPTISADGRLLSPLYVVLQEKTGSFGPTVKQNMFKAPNLFVEASKSGKVSKQHIKSWLENVYFKGAGNSSTLIVDALSQYVDEENIQHATPQGTELEVLRIPPGATGLIQPLDVYFFRPWKAIVRRIEDAALYEGHSALMHQRDNILKLQSLIHHQFSSPKYKNLIKYAWFNSGFLSEKPEAFDTPAKYCFPIEVENCSLCDTINFIRCSWCAEYFCFQHFFVAYHYCQPLLD